MEFILSLTNFISKCQEINSFTNYLLEYNLEMNVLDSYMIIFLITPAVVRDKKE